MLFSPPAAAEDLPSSTAVADAAEHEVGEADLSCCCTWFLFAELSSEVSSSAFTVVTRSCRLMREKMTVGSELLLDR